MKLRTASINLFVFIVTVAFFAACSPELEGDTFRESQLKGAADLTVVYVPSSGFAYHDEDGNLTGVVIDIMEEFADFVHHSQGIDIRYNFLEEPDWTTFYQDVKNAEGGVFGLGNVTITEQRRLELKFSPPYLTNVAVLVTHESVDELNELHAIATGFEGLSGLAFKGTLHEDRVKNLRDTYWDDMHIDYATSNDEIIRRITAEGNLFSYIDIYNFWRAAEQGYPLRQHPAGDLASERFGVIMPLNSDWDKLISDFFEQGQGFRTSRTYREILEKHLGPELTEKLEQARIEANQY